MDVDLESEFAVMDEEVTPCLGDENEESLPIELKEPVYLRELFENKGLIFETVGTTHCQDSLSNEPFFKHENVVKHLHPPMSDTESDSELNDNDFDEKTPFEQIASKMEDISGGDGCILKKVIKKGSGEIVSEGSVVTIHYSAYLEYADEPFDSTYLRSSPLRVRLQWTNEACLLVVGLEMGIRTMRTKETARFLVQPAYAYGSLGCQPRIPGDSVILFEVELLDMVNYNAATDFNNLSHEEKIEARFDTILTVAKSEHAAGNNLFKRGSFNLAVRNFMKGVNLLEKVSLRDQADQDEQQKLLLKLYLNLSLCFLNKDCLIKVLTYCNKALEIDKNCVKALYRRGLAKTKLGEYKVARKSLLDAKALAPTDTKINAALVNLQKKQTETHEREKLLYSSMYNCSNNW